MFKLDKIMNGLGKVQDSCAVFLPQHLNMDDLENMKKII